MTEADWLTCADPTLLLEFRRGQASERKLRLFAVACCRPFCDFLIDERSRKAVEFCEALAENSAPQNALAEVHREAWAVLPFVDSDLQVKAARAAGRTVEREAYSASYLTKNEVVELEAELASQGAASASEDDVLYWQSKSQSERRLSHLFRDISGNPFRPRTFNPDWLTPSVVALAQAIYDERAFDRLPELADSLVKAGCDNQDILDHCRSEGPHVRGCWVVDLVLGKG